MKGNLKYGLFVTFFLLSACGREQEVDKQTESVDSGDLSISISVEIDEEEIDDLHKEVDVEEGDILLDVMQSAYDIDIEDGFLTKIEEYEQNPDTNQWWLYEVNNEQVMIGANEYEVEDQDEIRWILNELE
ncbi:DUF4430 domain-containing protein [Lacticigenium naphthae]|uniref:DUF4430 domain-containing protein n=1 Tax=Lacticigenium naphthae TaxID=515351 RepID=UPI000425A9A8|nr:DUF4430 domain-containing protein [Lacticigenium naphthae]